MFLFWIGILALAIALPPAAVVAAVFAWAWCDRAGRRLVPGYRAWSSARDEARWLAFRSAGRRAWRHTRRRLDADRNQGADGYKVDVRSR